MKQTPEGNRTIRYYTLKNQPYSGWALQLFENNEHKYRYMKFEQGLTVWQIGYYDNGDLDLDFHLKDGVNCGSQRMWRKHGAKYIDTYMAEGGKQEGIQLRWHANNILAREAMFDNGKAVYEVLFNTQGAVTKTSGKVPEKYR